MENDKKNPVSEDVLDDSLFVSKRPTHLGPALKSRGLPVRQTSALEDAELAAFVAKAAQRKAAEAKKQAVARRIQMVDTSAVKVISLSTSYGSGLVLLV